MTETTPAQPQTQPQPQNTTAQLKRGVVKQVLSGDAIVLRGPPVNGPPKEMTVYLSNVSAPRLAKRPTDNSEGTPDEPYAWESREFLRKKVVGKEVTFFRDFTATSGREHGRIYLGDSENAENVTESSVAEGWVEVRQGTKGTDEYTQKLNELQEAAKASKKGKWGPEEEAKNHIRDIKWTIDNPRNFVDSLKQKPQKAVIEQVRDGATVRALLLPDFHYITLVMSGVKAPMVRTGAEGKVVEADPYGEEARFYTESRILQRDVEVVLESVSNQNFVGSIVHPNGNIAEMLLRDGFAKCVDWSIALASCGTEVYRTAERYAKEHKLRLWKTYQPSAALSGDKKSFQAKVMEIVMGDALVIKKDSGEVMKIWLSSIRPPK
uniref:TNase-like domain-containing protein n=1 Tax=Plectus sambesii TaxID=2011161 RepID=A0A914W4V5_9BILA